MKSTHRKILTWIALFACSAIYNFDLLKIPVGFYDEGIILAGAERVLKGQLPYLDFWSMYPPGQYFMLAFLFKLFGTSILTERIYDLAIRSLLSTLIYVILKKIQLPNKIAMTGWAIALIYLGSFGFTAYPIYTAILLILFGVYFVALHIETNKIRYLVYAGMIIAASSLFRHDLSGMAAIGILFTLFFGKIVKKEAWLHSVFAFIFGILLVGLPVSIYLASTIGVPLIVNQLLLTPAEIMPRYRWVPYPTPFPYQSIQYSYRSIQFYVYPLALFAGFFASFFMIVRLKIHSTLSYGMFLLSLTGILFLNQARVRSDSVHLLPAVLLCTIVWPSLFHVLYNSMISTEKTKFTKVASYLLLAMITVTLAEPLYHQFRLLDRNYFSLPENSYRSGYASIESDLQGLVSFIRKNTKETDDIYVGVGNHDQFLVNDVIVYFLAGRQYATKYHELHPGVTNKLNIQNEIIQELKSAPARLLVLVSRYWYEPNDTRVDSKIDCLDNYIREEYELTNKFGIYEVWTQKSPGDIARHAVGHGSQKKILPP